MEVALRPVQESPLLSHFNFCPLFLCFKTYKNRNPNARYKITKGASNRKVHGILNASSKICVLYLHQPLISYCHFISTLFHSSSSLCHFSISLGDEIESKAMKKRKEAIENVGYREVYFSPWKRVEIKWQ